jgi:L-iditol 2-dehydrogenase
VTTRPSRRTMRAAVLYDVDDLRIETRPVPEIGEGELLVQTRAGGICSSDTMAWYVRGKAPLVLGHEPAGVIAAIGAHPHDESGRPFAVGDRVFVHHHAPCFACATCERKEYVQCATWRASRIDPGGLAEYFRVPLENVRDTLLLPENVSFVDASLVEPLGCVVKSLRRSEMHPGDLVFVIGLGVMGLMHVLLALHRGARVIASDFLVKRCALAERAGARAAHPDDAAVLLREMSGGRGADVVICGPGTSLALRSALAAVAPAGTVVMFTPLDPSDPLALDANDLYFRDLRLVGSYSCGPNDTREALALIADGVVTAERLGATLFPLDRVAEAYRELLRAKIVKPIVTFDSEQQ